MEPLYDLLKVPRIWTRVDSFPHSCDRRTPERRSDRTVSQSERGARRVTDLDDQRLTQRCMRVCRRRTKPVLTVHHQPQAPVARVRRYIEAGFVHDDACVRDTRQVARHWLALRVFEL